MTSEEYLSKTKAKKEFFLLDEELDSLTSIKSGSSILYLKKDIIDLAIEKYDLSTEPELSQYLLNLKNEKLQRVTNKQKDSKENHKKAVTKRLNTLSKELTKLGIENFTYELCLADQFSYDYVEGNMKYGEQPKTAIQVARWIAQRKFLHEYTDYDRLIEESRNYVFELAEEKNMSYIPDIYFRDIKESCEKSILEKIGGYPSIFPWMKKEE
jgi:hypothetical protein